MGNQNKKFKKILKIILSFMCYVLLIPCTILITFALTWYLLPAVQSTPIGVFLTTKIFTGKNDFLIATIIASVLTLILIILKNIFKTIKASKVLNFYTHILTWFLAFVLIAEAGYTFIISDTITTVAFKLDNIRKLGILICIFAMILHSMISPKFKVLVNRKIQAYDTAKELNMKGRSSVIGMQILKCIDFIFPEMFLLIALCFAFNWEISMYFVFILCAFIIPLVGNMICDYRVKKEAVKKQKENQQAQIRATALAVADILRQRGEI